MTLRVAICVLLIVNVVFSAPNRRGAPGMNRPASPVVSTNRGRRLEQRYRFGLDKAVTSDWNVNNQFYSASLRDRPRTPVEIAAPRPQLNGKMGNGEAPRRVARSEQFQPASYTAPRRGLRSSPAALTTMSESDKQKISNEFFIKYNYTWNQLSDHGDLVRRMQRNYGLSETGVLDEPTVTAMLRPRCGYPDGPAEYNLFPNREHWTNKDVTYQITGYSSDMSQCQIRNAFKRAFRVWEEVTDLNFEMVDTDDADIIVYFGHAEHGDGYSFDGPNGLLAHAFTPGTDAISGDSHFDEAEFWTLGKGKVFDTYGGNAGGDPCVFPFYFESTQYSSCTSAGRDDGIEWCATTENYDDDRKWAFCPHELLFTYGGNGNNDPCVFPFTFLGETYEQCTYEGRTDGYSWCATTSDYDTDARWGFCPSRAHGTSGGNANGDACVFPFQFEGYTYVECTTVGRNDYKLWCATTHDYDTDGMWGFCDGEGYSLFLVAAHEFGHAIGLDHSNQAGALMYPMYSYMADFDLPNDDIQGARSLYGPRRRALPPLRLEKCGGDLTKTETATTTARPTTTPRSTTTRRTRPTTTSRTRRPTTTPRTVDRCDSPKPTNICDRPIDAIMTYQGNYFIFQGSWLWMVRGRGKRQIQEVALVTSYWAELKCGIDGGYQRPHDHKLMFFKGSRYYIFTRSTIERGYPRDVTELGLPIRSVVDDVVFMPTRNPTTRVKEDRLYYFVGNKVYRADPITGNVTGEPTTLGQTEAWEDLPSNLDAVFRESLDKPYTIFLKGNKFYRYENYRGRVDFQRRNIKKLFRCKARSTDVVALPLVERRRQRGRRN